MECRMVTVELNPYSDLDLEVQKRLWSKSMDQPCIWFAYEVLPYLSPIVYTAE